MQHVHFTAIGGSVILELAIAVSKKNDYKVTVSGENLSEATQELLRRHRLLPDKQGWFPEQLNRNIIAVVYGIDAQFDNPELVRAREMGLKVYSSHEYLFIQTRNKTRIVVSGSHGKTTITAMILYVMKQLKMDADFLTGTRMKGYDSIIRLSYESRIAVFDGDENFSSSIDKRPRFHLYKPHIAVLTGIAHDYSVTYPDFEEYKMQFDQFINLMETQGRLIYYSGDPSLTQLTGKLRHDLVAFPYNTPPYEINDGVCYICHRKGKTALKVSGEALLRCVQAAMLACRQIGISEEKFFSVIGEFTPDIVSKQVE